MKKLTLFFACIALATSFNCSQAMAGFVYSVSSATSSGFVTPGGAVTADISFALPTVTFNIIAQNVGTIDPDFFAPIGPDPVVSVVSGSPNITFVSSTSASASTGVGALDQIIVGTVEFDASSATNFETATFDIELSFADERTGFPIDAVDANLESFSLTLTAVPEPTTLCMFGVGMVGLVARRRRNSIS